MDGVITNQQLQPGREPGTATFTITGEDVSLMMDLHEKSAEHPAQDETIIANKLILSYAQYGLIPMVLPPLVIDPPIPIERVPVQQATDLQYLVQLAERHAYVFYVAPGPAPFTNTAYWGPPKRLDLPQRALNVNLGSETNVDSLNFSNNALAPTMVSGSVQDRTTNQSVPVRTFASTRPPLASQPAWLLNQPNVRTQQFRATGLNITQSYARAQAITDNAADVVTAEGELDALRYNGLLQARGLVGLRGAGYSYDGFYYVKRVTHTIRKGSYKQRFTLTRDGVGAISPVVVP
jgi:phage protein D